MSRPISLVAGAILAAAAAAGTAQAAEPIDFGALTCGDFLDATEDGQRVMALWLDGHLSSNPEESKLDVETILQRVPDIVAACEESRTSRITGVYETQQRLWVETRPATAHQ